MNGWWIMIVINIWRMTDYKFHKISFDKEYKKPMLSLLLMPNSESFTSILLVKKMLPL